MVLIINGVVSLMVKISVCDSVGCQFESDTSPQIKRMFRIEAIAMDC